MGARFAIRPIARPWGTVQASNGASVTIAGLAGLARIGDLIEIESGALRLPGEIVAIDQDGAHAFLMSGPDGLAVGQRAWLTEDTPIRPGTAWLGEVLDCFGCRADGSRPAPGNPGSSVPSSAPRRGLGRRLVTGIAALDTFLPLCRGQRAGVFAGSGVGKSRLLSDLALKVQADVIVIGLIGERSREAGDFVRRIQSSGGMDRTVIISATAEMPALMRRRAAILTLRTAEAFRDQGLHVLCLVDSLTRYAEAHREIALAAGEPPALRAFPPSTAASIAGLCERAGTGHEGDAGGDVTAVFTVLVAGSDQEEPVADMVRGTLDGHVILSREIAERGRFPAIDLRASVSRSAPDAWTDEEEAIIAQARRLIAAFEEALPMIQAGLYMPGADPMLDQAVKLWPMLDAFAASPGGPDSFARLAMILDGREPPPQ